MLTATARLSRRTRFGFTLVELVVVVVILAVIAALAVPALQAVKDRTHDEVAVIELQALHREAAALAALSGGHAISADDVETAAADVAAAAGTHADQALRHRPQLTVDTDGKPVPSVPSEAYGNVSWDVGHDPEHRDVVDLAMVSRAGNCAFLRGGVTTTLIADIVEVDVATGGCVANVASPLEDIAGGVVAAPAPEEEQLPILDPVEPVLDPDPATDGDDAARTIHEPPLAGGDPDELTGGVFAIASFPSAHSAPPHKLYATLPDAGAIVEITDNGASPATARLISTAFGAPAGIAAGADPSASDRAYRVAYVTDRAAGTLVKWNVATGARTTVTSGLSNPGHVAGWACFDTATGARIAGSDVCAYVTTDTGIVQVNIGTGAKSTISSHSDATGLVTRVVDGQPRLVISRAGSATLTATSLAGVDDAAPLATLDGPVGLHRYGTAALVADATAGKLRSVSAAGQTTDLASIAGVRTAHYHGVPGIAYGANDRCVYRAQGGAATELWCSSVATWQVSTFAGSGASQITDGTGTDAAFHTPISITYGGGNLWVGDYNRVRRVSPSGQVTSFATGGSSAYVTGIAHSGGTVYMLISGYVRSLDPATGTTAVVASGMYNTAGLTTGPDGALYTTNNGTTPLQIRRIDPASGTVETVAHMPAGTASRGVGADTTHLWISSSNGLHKVSFAAMSTATPPTASLVAPVATDSTAQLAVTSDHVYTADGSHAVVQVAKSSGQIAAVAGVRTGSGYRDGLGRNAWFNFVSGVASDGNDLYVADQNNDRIRKLTEGSFTGSYLDPTVTTSLDIAPATVSTFAGSGVGQVIDGTGTDAAFHTPVSITRGGGYLWVGDYNTVRRIDSSGQVTSFASGGSSAYVTGVAYSAGSVYMLAGGGYIRALDPDSGGTAVVAAGLYNTAGLTTGPDGMLYTTNNGTTPLQIRRVDPARGTVETVAYMPAGTAARGVGADSTHLWLASTNGLHKVAFSEMSAANPPTASKVAPVVTDSYAQLAVTADHVYTVDGSHAVVQVAKTSGEVTAVAGTRNGSGYRDGTGHNAWFNHVSGIASDGTALYVTDQNNRRVRKLAAGGFTEPWLDPAVTTSLDIAPGTTTVFAGGTMNTITDGTGTDAAFHTPVSITRGGGYLWVGDYNTVRRIDSSGQVTSFASGGSSAYLTGVAYSGGTVYMLVGGTVRSLDPVSGATTQVASGMFNTAGLTTGPDGALYTTNNGTTPLQIRRVDPALGTVETVAYMPAGTAARGVGADSTHLWLASTNGLHKVAFAAMATDAPPTASKVAPVVTDSYAQLAVTADHVYTADGSHAVVQVAKSSGAVSEVAGVRGTLGNVEGTGVDARFNHVSGITSDGTALYVTDQNNDRVRKVE